MVYKITKKTKRSKKILVGLIIIVMLGIGGYFSYKNFFSNNNQNKKSTDNINYSPPTEQEQQAGDKQKQRITEEQDSFKDRGGVSTSQHNSDNSQPNDMVTIMITDAAQYDDIIEVRAFVPNHYEDGSCKITLTQGSKKVEKETPAYRDVSTTICTNPLFARSEFSSSGDWEVVVSYNAPGASGTSNAKVVHLR